MTTAFALPPKSSLDALLDISESIERGKDIPFTVNDDLVRLLGVPLDDYVTTMDGALKLRDIIFAGQEYLNIDIREYDDSRGRVFLIKLENDYGESNGDHHTRAGALLDALLGYVTCEIEMED